MKYWWVNHKKTSKHEIAGGFLWSPMRKKNGGRNQFYDNMRVASPGDLVISYSHAKISFVGVVADFAIPCPKPPSFEGAGENWDKNNGWMLPVKWQALASPVVPKQKLSEFNEFLPEKYSPLDPVTGNGRENAYLAEVVKDIFDRLLGDLGIDVNAALLSSGSTPLALKDIDEAIEREILNDRSLDSTTQQRLVKSRLGQEAFKKNIYEFESFCRVTKVKTPGLLVASHIKPWRLCISAFERLDGANGLLLAPHVDRLFDRGLISFSDAGGVLVSSRLSNEDVNLLGLAQAFMLEGVEFDSRQIPYLDYHRGNVFLL
jgi:hypothetical protein